MVTKAEQKRAQELCKALEWDGVVQINLVVGKGITDYVELWCSKNGDVTDLLALALGQKLRGSFPKAGGTFLRVRGYGINKRLHAAKLLELYTGKEIEWEDGYTVIL